MAVNRKELLSILDKVSPGLSSTEILEQSSSFVFKDGLVMTFNDEISVSHPVPYDWTGAVVAKELIALLKKYKDDELDVTLSGEEFLIKTKRGEAGIRLDAEIQLPIDDIAAPKQWKPLPKNFHDAIDFTLFTTGKDLSRPVLSCIHLIDRYAESSDNYRLTSYDMGEDAAKAFPKSVLLPVDSARQLLNYTLDRYSVAEGWLHFRAKDKVVYSCRSMEGDFPSLSDFLDVKGTKFEIPDDLADTLDRAGIFSLMEAANFPSVDITLAPGWLHVESKNETGWVKEKIRLKYKGDEVTFTVNPAFLQEVLGRMKKAIVGEKMIKFEGDNFQHVAILSVK